MPRHPEPSRELDADGRKLYFRLRAFVVAAGDWADSDQVLTNEACLREQRARQARAQIDALTVAGSTGSVVVHPLVRIAEAAEKAYVDCLRELGLTRKQRAQFGEAQRPKGDDPLSKAFGV